MFSTIKVTAFVENANGKLVGFRFSDGTYEPTNSPRAYELIALERQVNDACSIRESTILLKKMQIK